MKHTGLDKDRMGSGKADGLRFVWQWEWDTKSERKPNKCCEAVDVAHDCQPTVSAWEGPGGIIEYTAYVDLEYESWIDHPHFKSRLDAQKAAEQLLLGYLQSMIQDYPAPPG